MWLAEAAPAKVNLTLLVTGRRADGYHLLDSLVVFGPAADVLRGRSAAELSLAVAGPFAAGLQAEPDNLVLRAARGLAALTGRANGAELVLEKHLPVASGIGGGSADAAAALRLLCRLWQVHPAADVLGGLAASLGADVPVCLPCRPARMTGIGEVIDPVPPLPAGGLLLVNPGIAVATADVFRARTGPFSAGMAALAEWPDVQALAADVAGYGNDLQAPAFSVAPAIAAVQATLQALPGCLAAGMSGSGATCFALFPDAAGAGRAGAALPGAWWRSAGPLSPPPPFTNGGAGSY